MKIAKTDHALTSAVATAGITADNYLERAKSFVALAGGGFTIRAFDGERGSLQTKQPVTEAQWASWMKWFEAKRIKTSFLVRWGMGTVPCEWPEDFDLEAPISDRAALLPMPRATLSDNPDAARRVRDLVDDLVGPSRRPGKAKPRDAREESTVKADALAHLEQLKQHYQDNPLSDFYRR